MNAGYELDCLIADKFFGEPKPPHPGNGWYQPHSSSGGEQSPQKRWYMTTNAPDHGKDGQWGGWKPMPYSQYVHNAWDVMEKLRTMFSHVALHADNGWGCTVWNIDEDGESSDWIGPFNADTAPLAICLTAKAVAEVATPNYARIEALYAKFKERLVEDGGNWPEYTGPGQ